jgi:hypothetical protein
MLVAYAQRREESSGAGHLPTMVERAPERETDAVREYVVALNNE